MGPKVQQKTKEQKMAAALAGSRTKKKVTYFNFEISTLKFSNIL